MIDVEIDNGTANDLNASYFDSYSRIYESVLWYCIDTVFQYRGSQIDRYEDFVNDDDGDDKNDNDDDDDDADDKDR